MRRLLLTPTGALAAALLAVSAAAPAAAHDRIHLVAQTLPGSAGKVKSGRCKATRNGGRPGGLLVECGKGRSITVYYSFKLYSGRSSTVSAHAFGHRVSGNPATSVVVKSVDKQQAVVSVSVRGGSLDLRMANVTYYAK